MTSIVGVNATQLLRRSIIGALVDVNERSLRSQDYGIHIITDNICTFYANAQMGYGAVMGVIKCN